MLSVEQIPSVVYLNLFLQAADHKHVLDRREDGFSLLLEI